MTRLEQLKAQIAGYAGESIDDRRRFAERLAETLTGEVDELQRRLDAVVVVEPETDIAKAVHSRLYLVMFSELFGGIPEALHFRRDKDGEWFWSKYPPNEGGPLYGKSNTVLWFAEIRAVAIAEGRGK